MPPVPTPRGPLSEAVVEALRGAPGSLRAGVEVPAPAAALSDDDFQVALYACYELHYRGLDGVDERWEWDPGLLALRARMEDVFEDGLRDALASWTPPPAEAGTMDLSLRAIADGDAFPSLSRHLERHGSLEEFKEFVIHRSAYQLKEADPHSWAIPRLAAGPKAALLEVQADEYGGGDPVRMHARLFADTMEELGLDATYGAYVDALPGATLATVNLMSYFGLHRRHRGRIVGHLALFEMTSSIPNRRYATALRRLGVRSARATGFYDEHVTADAVHENVAAVDLAGGLVRLEPALADDILFGARALVELEGRWAACLLESWRQGRSSLRHGATSDAALVA